MHVNTAAQVIGGISVFTEYMFSNVFHKLVVHIRCSWQKMIPFHSEKKERNYVLNPLSYQSNFYYLDRRIKKLFEYFKLLSFENTYSREDTIWINMVTDFVRSRWKLLNRNIISTKGQIMSECILWNHRFSKIPPKNLIDFCPGRFYRLGT